MTWEVIEGDAMLVLRDFDAESFDAVITDPSYASGGTSTVDRRRSGNQKYLRDSSKNRYPLFVEGELRDQRSWTIWIAHILSECYRVARPGAVIALFSDWRQVSCLTDAIQVAGWCLRGLAPWDKTEASRNQPGRFPQQCEFIAWGSKGDLPLDRETMTPGRRLPGVFRQRVDPRQKKHVTGKPIALMHELLKICSPGSHVLDPFCGSGATGVAALRHGFAFTGIEMSPEYAEIARTELQSAENRFAPVRKHGDVNQLTLDAGTARDEHEPETGCPV